MGREGRRSASRRRAGSRPAPARRSRQVAASLAAVATLLAAGRGASGAGAAAPGTSSARRPPISTPASANPDLVIASPAPGTRTASATTQISLLGKAALRGASISVTGSRSGAHSGRIEPYSTGNGESFLPSAPFVAGEEVTVRTGLDVAGAPSGTYRFRIGERVVVRGQQPLPALSTRAPQVDHFASAPGIEPPAVVVRTGKASSGGASSGGASTGGDVFLTPKGAVGRAGPMIVSPAGRLIWFRPLSGEEAFDLDVQRLGTRPVLTWFQGVVVDGHGVGEDVIADDSYRTLDVLHGGNGFAPDLHEFQLAPDGVALVTSYQALRWNLAPVGGPRQGIVWDGILQEIDVRTGLVEYEWHSLDHVAVTASVLAPSHKAGHVFDYFHINSIQRLDNGDLLVSSRNTSAAYAVAPSLGGKVVWRLGGKASSFTMGAGTSFWLQHDVRELPGSTVTLFDNEASPRRRDHSSALVLHLDFAKASARLERAYSHDPAVLAGSLGNVQTLPGGDRMVGWGDTRYYSQLTSSGASVLEGALPKGDNSYRVYRYAWLGRPKSKPSVAISTSRGTTSIRVSWNGATGVVSWRVLGGASPGGLRAVATAADASFETALTVRGTYPALRVEAVGRGGAVLASWSNTSG